MAEPLELENPEVGTSLDGSPRTSEAPSSPESAPPSPDVSVGVDATLEAQAAVGSVTHLLSTTFKEIFKRTPIEDERVEETEEIDEREVIKPPIKDEEGDSEAGGVEGDGVEGGGGDEEKKDAEPSNPPQPEEGDISMPQPEGGDGKAAEGEAEEGGGNAVEEHEDEGAKEGGEEEERPWHLVRFDEIRDRLRLQHAQADNMLNYLSKQHKDATIDDVKSEHALKRVGLMQGAHVPIPYSTLDLDEMSSPEDPFGAFATNLVGAKKLVENNYERILRVSGTLPMSAFTSRTARKVKLEDVTKAPGYLKQTATNTKRSGMIMSTSHAPHGQKFDPENTTTSVRFDLAPDTTFDLPPPKARTIHDPDLAPHVEYITHDEQPIDLEFVSPVSGKDPNRKPDPNRLIGTGTEPPPKPQAEVRLEGEQWDLDMQVLDKMSEKLHYLKNPRYDKEAINHTRVLTRPLETEADLQEFAYTGRPKFKFPDGDHNYMVAQPDVVEFLDYAVDKTYEKVLYIRNATAVSRSITILPPATSFFSFTNIEFPSKSKSQLAPGMAAKITVRFCPDSLADYDDYCSVLSEGGKFKVKLWAHRPPPMLSIPSTLNVGACLVGDAKRMTFNCLNEGGKARFRMMLEEDWPIPKMAQDRIPALKTPPFVISPTEFNLDHRESVTITVDYSPLALGVHDRSFMIICDNCHVTKYLLHGSSESVFLRVSGVNDAFVENMATNPLSLQPKNLDFGITPLGAICERTVTIRNDTPLDLAFRWDMRNFFSSKNAKFEGWGGRPRSRQLSSGGGVRPKSRDNQQIVGALPGTEQHNDDPKGFEIEPRYGVFPAESDTTFAVRFNTNKSTTPIDAQIQSVLVVEGVPPSSIPSEDQAGLLKNLAEHGYGKYLRMQAWFKAMDSDGGGTIDREELREHLHALGLSSHQRAIRETLQAIDQDGDGEITIVEFMDGIPAELQEAIEKNLDTTDIGDVQDAIRREVDCLGFLMRSSSEYVKFTVDPLSLVFPGKLTAGVVYTRQVVVRNTSDVESSFEFGSVYYDNTDSLVPSSGGSSDVPDMNDYLVDVEPSRGMLPPLGEVSATVSFSAKPEGLVNLAMPVNVKGSNPTSSTCTIHLTADIVGPRLKITKSEVDFGLVAVGGHKECTIKFVNEGDVPLAWAAVYLSRQDGVDEKLEMLSSKLTTSPGKTMYGRKRSMGASSGKGRSMSTISSVSSLYSIGSTGMGSGNSPNSFKIESPHCKLAFSPQEGVLGPKETGKVVIDCAAGKLPQRLRATLAFLVSDETKEHDYESQYVSVRGEVQAPKVYLDATLINLGVTYTDVPVVRWVTLKNLSNLDTKYKWERPAGATPSFNVDFEPLSGSLASKEVLKCKVTYTAKVPGAIDDVYACKIFGMQFPLGFSLKTISKGVVVGYEKLEDGAPVPKPLCSPDAPQFIGDPEEVPQPGVPPKLHIPGDVSLFQRKVVRFVIRNFSACPARYQLRPRKYVPAELEDKDFGFEQKTTTRGSTRAGSTKGGKKKKLLLSNEHEITKVFQTAKGQEHTMAKLEYEEDRKILKGGLGFAIDVSPKVGFLAPWGVLVVTLRTYNNMPATYVDQIHCDITGAPLTRLDFKSSIIGCPLSLKPTSLGLDIISAPKLPNMKFGDVALNSKPMTRSVTVKNSGPIDALLKWSVREAEDDSDDNKVVALTFNDGVDATKPFDIKLGLYSKPRFESPFDIKPIATRLPKHSEKTFSITLNEVVTDEQIGDKKLWSQLMNCLMVADAQWQHPKPVPSLMGDASVASLDSRGGTGGASRRSTRRGGAGADDGGLERETMGAVKLGVSGTAVSPYLFLDKRRHGEKNAISEVEDKDVVVKQVVKISISAMEYKHFQNTGEVSDDMEQTFLLTNQLSISLDLALNLQGPFKIESAKTMTIPHPNYKNPSKEGWNTERGRLFRLPPNESVEVSVSFQPKVTPLSDGTRDDIDESKDMKLDAAGRLKIKYSTGQEQFIEMKGELLRPLVAIQPSSYHYGMCHVEDDQDIIVYVNNPTLVQANYKIVHIPEIKSKRQRMILDPDNELNKEHFDDPSAFVFSEYEGSQQGPTLPLPSSGFCLPDDKNRKRVDPVFTKSNMSLTWRSGDPRDLEFGEKLRKVNKVNPRHPRAITVKFKPHLDKRYRSRFRFEVEEGSGFDVVFSGRGTYIEHGKKNAPPHV